MSDFYRIEVADGHEGCEHCKAGTYWTIVYTEPDEDEPTEIGTSWADEETAQDICDLMNMAYDDLPVWFCPDCFAAELSHRSTAKHGNQWRRGR